GIIARTAESGKTVLGGIGGKPGQIFDNPSNASAALSGTGFETGLPNPAAGLPEGYQVPGFTRSMDQGGQAFFQQTVHQDRIANGQYRDLLENNTNTPHG